MRPQLGTGDREVADLAARQHGVVALWQLLELGFEARAVQRRVESGRLHRIYRGVYAVGHAKLSREGRLMAAVLACGRGAVLSHWHAADVWGLHSTSRGLVDVSTTRRAESRRGIRVHRTRRIERAVRDGIPVTTVARTLLDFAEVAPRRPLERAVDEAERRRFFDLNQIDAVIARNPGRRGIKPLTAVIENAVEPPATKRELEQRFAEFCEDAGLPRPAFNVFVEGFLVDAVWEKHKLIVELDSWQFHGGRQAFEDDRERDTTLQLAHYRVVRVTWRKLTREPQQLAKELRSLVEA